MSDEQATTQTQELQQEPTGDIIADAINAAEAAGELSAEDPIEVDGDEPEPEAEEPAGDGEAAGTTDQPAAVEKPAEAEASDSGQETPLDKSWKAVSAKENAIRLQADDIKRREQAIEARSAELDGRYKQQVEAFDSEMRSDPLGALVRRYGLTLNDLAERAISGQPGAAPQPTKGQVSGDTDTLKNEVTELRTTIQAMQAEKLVDKYRGRVEVLLEGSEFDLLRSRYDVDSIMDRASDFARKQIPLSERELLDRLQSEYREDLTGSVSHEAAIKALEAKGFRVSKPNQANDTSGRTSNEAPQGNPNPQTLTNSLDTSPPARSARDWSMLSEDEQIEEAIRASSG